MTKIYLNNWDSKQDVINDFFPEYREPKYKGELDNINILLASYTYWSYDGDAFVLFEKEGKLYEVNGSHCSCYGLEGQWDPEETTKEALLHRINEGTLGTHFGDNTFKNELLEVLDKL